MRKISMALATAAFLAGCATEPPYPAMRPLTAAYVETLGSTPVIVSENNSGIVKTWFFTSTQGAASAYGLVGVLVAAAMDAIINAGPSRRAQNAANEMEELMPVEALNASLAEHFRRQSAPQAPAAAEAQLAADPSVAAPAEVSSEVPSAPPSGVSYGEVRLEQRLTATTPVDDAIVVSTHYELSEDSSTLHVVASASYQSTQTPYSTPYVFEKAVPKAETEGPAYRNTFSYYSMQLPIPTLTPELRERLIASIQDSARDANGALPAEGSDDFRAMTRELENARDDQLTKNEIAIFLTREWLRDDGAMLRREIERAHEFIARYVMLDLNRPVAPSLVGQDELLETAADDRTVRRIGAGTVAGSYVSSAGNVTSFSTYGNTFSVARENSERIDSIRRAARSEARR